MKRALLFGEYVSPYVERVDIQIEKGFAISSDDLWDDNDGIFSSTYLPDDESLIAF